MNIIKANPDQYESVRAFYHSMIDAMAGSTVYVGWKKDIYPAPDFLKESIQKEELYLLQEGEQIAAAMVFNHDCNESYSKFEWRTAADRSEIMVIHALGVHPRFSGKGYAKALVQKAIDLAAENGMKAIRLDVLEGNIPAENLYLGFGFQYMATLRMYYEDTGWTNFKLYEYVLPEQNRSVPIIIPVRKQRNPNE
ncbi:MAG: GNAT family N-acetyltransferase [Oscillospiraceae bacterium]|nr:GNAT family N-acetyltransferase [Oscillospiraceae bacterium]MBR0393388.1 GNAT family N-acetyltransferase [Oscillospiraceae bacterium]